MGEELSEPCASIAFMTNLVYDRGVALEYDLVHDRLEDAERRLADLEDMMPQVYGLTELTTPEERADLVRALGKVRGYIQEGDAVMGQGAADEFNASFRSTMWNIIIRCKERVREEPWERPKEVVEPAHYWEVTNMVTGEILQSGKRQESISDAVRDAKKELRRGFQQFGDDHLVIKVFDKSPDERAGLTFESEYSESFWIKPEAGPSRPFPDTYGDWVNLGMDIKEKAGIDDVEMTTLVNRHLNHIYEEEQDPDVAQESKRWLVDKAGELGIK